MNAIENIERTLEEWGEQLRGGTSTTGLQPRDVLHAVLGSLEDHRVEGLDHKIYAPNEFVVQLNLDEEERSRLLPFLGADELIGAIQRYCQERKYSFRGPLELKVVEAGRISTAQESPAHIDPRGTRPHTGAQSVRKVEVTSRFDVSQAGNTDLSEQFNAPLRQSTPLTEHDADRRTPPTYADTPFRL